nr:hypothetical protein [uncultured Cohaesibacter sp.]
MKDLDLYFRSLTRFEYGCLDCCLFPANWVFRKTGKDPAKGLRFGPISEERANEILRAHGGLLRLLDIRFRGVGMRPTREPVDGDVGCVRVGDTVAGSVRKDGFWWVVTTAGRFPVPNAKTLRAWTF